MPAATNVPIGSVGAPSPAPKPPANDFSSTPYRLAHTPPGLTSNRDILGGNVAGRTATNNIDANLGTASRAF
jgi:hypothetical protein